MLEDIYLEKYWNFFLYTGKMTWSARIYINKHIHDLIETSFEVESGCICVLHRYTVRQQTLDDGVMSELLVADVDRSDSGSYSCYATNSFGTDQTSVVLSVQGKSISSWSCQRIEKSLRSGKVVEVEWKSTPIKWSRHSRLSLSFYACFDRCMLRPVLIMKFS